MSNLAKVIWRRFPIVLLTFMFSIACLKAYITVQTTLLGYKIGKAKQSETDLLEEQSLLKMDHAMLTRKSELIELSKNEKEKHLESLVSH